MAKFVPDPGEKVLKTGSIYTLQGAKVKFPVFTRYVITDRRFIWHDVGKWAFIYSQGLLWQLIVKGRPVSFPYSEMIMTRGKYGMNKELLLLSVPDGRGVLLDRIEKTLQFFRETLNTSGLGIVQHSSDEWSVQA